MKNPRHFAYLAVPLLMLNACTQEASKPSAPIAEPSVAPVAAATVSPKPTQAERIKAETRALLQQPRIDPITGYLEKHCAGKNSSAYKSACQKLTQARTQRCDKVEKRYQSGEKNKQQVKKLRRGYQRSCPDVVERFATVVQTEAAAQISAKVSADPNVRVCDEAYNTRDYATALSACEPLAKRGHPKAQLKLGLMYANGRGVAKDHQEAYIWFALAVQGGMDAAAVFRDSLAKSLTTKQLLEANERALTITSQYH